MLKKLCRIGHEIYVCVASEMTVDNTDIEELNIEMKIFERCFCDEQGGVNVARLTSF